MLQMLFPVSHCCAVHLPHLKFMNARSMLLCPSVLPLYHSDYKISLSFRFIYYDHSRFPSSFAPVYVSLFFSPLLFPPSDAQINSIEPRHFPSSS